MTLLCRGDELVSTRTKTCDHSDNGRVYNEPVSIPRQLDITKLCIFLTRYFLSHPTNSLEKAMKFSWNFAIKINTIRSQAGLDNGSIDNGLN